MMVANIQRPIDMRPSDTENWAERELLLLERSLTVTYLAEANLRFDNHVRVEFLGCHYWAGSKDDRGYGKFRLADRVVRAHRFAYERTKGLIPDLLQVDHVCGIPPCVNPDHLQLVTQQQNLALARIRAGKPSSYSRQDALNDGLAIELVDLLLYESEPAWMQQPPAWGPPLINDTWDQVDEGWSGTPFHLN